MVNFSLKQTALIIGIAIVFTFFVFFTVEAFYPQPKYEDYCNQTYKYSPRPIATPYDTQKTGCSDPWINKEVEKCQVDKGTPTFKVGDNGCDVYDTCDFCSVQFQKQNDLYQRNIFIISAIVGIASILFGLYFSVAFMSGGFLFGGILVLAAGTIRYFASGHVDRYLRMAVLFVELVILIWIGYRKVVKKEKP